MSARSRPGWRHLLRTHAPAFLAWLEAEKVFDDAFNLMASDLQGFLLGLLDGPAIANDFMKAIPDVLGKCNDDICGPTRYARSATSIFPVGRYAGQSLAHSPRSKHQRRLSFGTDQFQMSTTARMGRWSDPGAPRLCGALRPGR